MRTAAQYFIIALSHVGPGSTPTQHTSEPKVTTGRPSEEGGVSKGKGMAEDQQGQREE